MSDMPKRRTRAPREKLPPEDWEVAIPTEIRATLLWRHMTQKQLVDALGVEQSWLSRRITGAVRMTPGELFAICDVLDEDLNTFTARAKHNFKHPPHGDRAMRVA